MFQSSRPSLRSHHTSAALHVAPPVEEDAFFGASTVQTLCTKSKGPQHIPLVSSTPPCFFYPLLILRGFRGSSGLADLLTARRPKKFNAQTFEKDSSAHKHPQLPGSPCQRRPWPQVADHTELFLNPPRQLRMLGARLWSARTQRTPSGSSG